MDQIHNHVCQTVGQRLQGNLERDGIIINEKKESDLITNVEVLRNLKELINEDDYTKN